MICPGCLQDVPSGFRFCGSCGTSLQGVAAAVPVAHAAEERAERRRLTVMFCDLVDSTQLSAWMDPEDTHAFLRQYHELSEALVARHDGYVAQHLGDGLLAYFGFPHAHEDDPVRAIHAGLEIVSAIAAMRSAAPLPDGFTPAVRIGIHTGEVVTAEMGTSMQRERLALGDTPNIAARLQGLAERNTVLVSEASRRLAGVAFEFEALGERQLRGARQPIEVFRPLRPVRLTDRYQAAHYAPMVGRADELRRLRAAFQAASTSGSQTMRISGEPGMGKTRLLVEFKASLQEMEHAWIVSRCVSDDGGSFLAPIRETVSDWAGIDDGQPWAMQVDVLDRALEALRGSVSVVMRRALCRLLNIPAVDDDPWLAGSPEQQKGAIFAAIREWLVALSRTAPLVYAVEDLHWADASTFELLDHLRRELADAPVLSLLSHRNEGKIPEWMASAELDAIALGPLSRSEAEHLVRASSTPIDELTIGRIVDRAEGIPLFIQELAKVATANGTRPPNATDRVELPDRVRDLFSARLDALGTTKRIAGMAAVIGHEFSADLLGHVAELDSDALLVHLHKLTREGVVLAADETSYSFAHALIRDAALANMLRSSLSAYHLRVAEALELHYADECQARPERIARHWRLARVADRALPYFVEAALRARSVYANVEALSLYEEAIQLASEGAPPLQTDEYVSRLVDVYEGLGDVYALLRRNDLASQALTTAAARSDSRDRLRRARLHRKLGMTSREAPDHGIPLLDAALAALGDQPAGDSTEWWHEWLQIHFELSITHYQLSSVDDMLLVAQRIEPMLAMHGTPHQRAEHANQMMLIDRRLHRFAATPACLRHSNDFVAAAEETDDLPLKAAAATARAMILMDHGLFEGSMREFERAIELCNRSGHRSAEIRALAYFAVLHRRRGDIGETARVSERARAAALEADMPQYAATSDGNLSWVAWKRNDIEQAIALGERAHQVLHVNSARSPFFWVVLLPLAAAHVARGDYFACVQSLRRMTQSDQQVLEPDLMTAMEQASADDSADPLRRRRICDEVIRLAQQHRFL